MCNSRAIVSRLRLANGQLVAATAVVAGERSAGMVLGSPFVRPGAIPAPATLKAGTRVTLVARWTTTVSGALTLARWHADAGQMFGVFAERDLDDGR